MAKNEYVTNKPRGIVDLGILLMSEFSKRHKEIYHTLIWGKADKTNEVKPNVQFLLDLTFEWITKSNLKKLVIVYDEDENELIGISKGMTKKIEKYREHMMHEKNEMIEFRFFPVAECDSMGDVIRELHDKRLLRESFLVVQNGFISSKPLNEFIYKHRDISIKDKNCILTSIYLECGDDLDRSYGYICPNTEDESLTAIMSMDTQRILALRLGKPITEFESDQSFIIRFNLYSAGLYICHEGCGNLFVDNFDFKTFENLISSTLADYDILQYNVYIELLNITNSTNFLSNFTVLGNSLIRIIQQQYLLYPEKLFNYNLNRTHYNVYTNPKLTQLRSCKCVKNLLILKNTKINKPLILTNTYIGEDCTIDENVVLKNCIILNNVCIKKDVYLKNCIVSNDCTIHSISNLTNCYLSANVIIGGVNGVHIVNRRLYPVPLENDGEDEPITVSPDMGSLANCFAYTSYARRRSTSMCSSYMETESDSSEEDFFDYDEVDETDPNKFTQSENEGTEKNMEIKFSEFSKLLYCTLVDSYNEKTNYENTIIEINSLKHAYSHVHITNLIELLIINLFKLTMKLSKETEQEFTVGIFCKFFEKVFQFYHPVINRYIKSHETAQMILLNAISTLYLKPEYETIFKSIQRVLHFLYNEIDVIDDHFIECWFDDLFKDAQNNEFLIDLKKFMEWMRQDDDESDEDTEDDSTRSSSRILSSNDL